MSLTTSPKKKLFAEIAEYRHRTHRTKKHSRTAYLVLANFWKRSRREKVDLWEALGSYEHPVEKSTVTGTAIKKAFRDYMLEKQRGRCCYCRCWLHNNAYAKPIEHVLPRSSYKQFSLDFWNLAVACVDCNLGKGNRVWGTVPVNAQTYPNRDDFGQSFHPRLHLYNEHVRYIMVETNTGGIALYRGLTPQGKHLCSELLDIIASKRVLLDNNQQLSRSISEIDAYRAQTKEIATPELDAFAKCLDQKLRLMIGI